jgi:hypothetical protein
VAVYPNSQFAGFVDVTPLVQQLGADGSPIDHGVIHNVPYLRVQGGVNAIIIDPHVGDMGIGVFCSRDISGFKNARKLTPPNSRRQYDFSDCLYIGGILNAAPTRFIQFTDTGIIITANTTLTINGNIQVNGSINATGDIVGQGTSLHNHTHKGVQPGSGNTGAPN